jgi:6-phosphogluconolactonase
MRSYKTERGEVRVYDDAGEIARAGAEEMARCISGVLADHNRAYVALAGGSTPKAMYQLLATPAWRDRVEWARIEIFFGDERCVPPDHGDSNYRMAREALLDHVPLPADRVHRIAGERKPEEAAAGYETILRRVTDCALDDKPCLDLVLLGMGPDGHTASLFPGTRVLKETHALAAAVLVEKLNSWRVTMTAPVLSAAAHVLFNVSGAEKADAFDTAMTAPKGTVPIQLVEAQDRVWLVDRAAAQKWLAKL